jgi:hypothetical protein
MSSAKFFRYLGRPRVILVSLLVTAVFVVYFNVTEKASEDAPGIMSLQLAFTEETFGSIVDQWLASGMLDVRRRNLWVDLLFPLAYGSFLAGVWAWGSMGGNPGKRVPSCLVLPFLGGVLDWTENGLHLVLLRHTSGFSSNLVLAASIAASIKWLLVGLSAVLAGWAAVERLMGFRR